MVSSAPSSISPHLFVWMSRRLRDSKSDARQMTRGPNLTNILRSLRGELVGPNATHLAVAGKSKMHFTLAILRVLSRRNSLGCRVSSALQEKSCACAHGIGGMCRSMWPRTAHADMCHKRARPDQGVCEFAVPLPTVPHGSGTSTECLRMCSSGRKTCGHSLPTFVSQPTRTKSIPPLRSASSHATGACRSVSIQTFIVSVEEACLAQPRCLRWLDNT